MIYITIFMILPCPVPCSHVFLYVFYIFLFLVLFIMTIYQSSQKLHFSGNDSNLLIVFYVQIMPDDFVMQLHRF
ncbi:hypothetical protein MWK78_08140 [Escherichia coli]|nr:hypothetical protein [Escherichia coli]